jgi:ABC transporter substrate binding protein
VSPRWATADKNEIRKQAVGLVALAPDVIVAHGASTVRAMLDITRTVPVVFPAVSDPIGAGFVHCSARPARDVPLATALFVPIAVLPIWWIVRRIRLRHIAAKE